MASTQVENLNFFAAEMNRQAIPIGYLREPGLLIFRRDTIPLHLSEEIGPVVFVADLDNVLEGNVAPRIVIVERRGNQKANRLFDHTGNHFSLLACDGF